MYCIALSPDDTYRDVEVECRLPHDHLLDKPDELAKLSSEVKTYRLEDLYNE